MALKPIRVWVTPPGPNPWKVVWVLEELQLPYEIVSIRFEDVKSPTLTDLNPNGRVPVIEDPNNGNLVLWESNAILTYLTEQYDSKPDQQRISTSSSSSSSSCLEASHHINQYLHFQASGQGPYYGPAAWFLNLHHEILPSAYERYRDQTRRVLGVLEALLEKSSVNGSGWLVGGRMTIADMCFVPWNDRVEWCLGELQLPPLEPRVKPLPQDRRFDGFPRVKAWHEKMTALPSWGRAMARRDELMKSQNLGENGLPEEVGVEGAAEYLIRDREAKGDE